VLRKVDGHAHCCRIRACCFTVAIVEETQFAIHYFEFLFQDRKAMKELLTIFPPLMRFSLDTDAT